MAAFHRQRRQHTFLLVQHREGAVVVPLTLGKAMVIGRAAPSDVVVADVSLSRQHARFSIEDGRVVVEDLGSTNGATHRARLVERAELEHGDQVQLGAVAVTVHADASGHLDAEEIASHDRFARLVDDEVRRARFFRRPLCVAMVRAGDATAGPSTLLQELRPLLRPIDRIGQYAAGVLEVVVPEMAGRELAERLGRDRSGSALVAGVAQFPDMGASTEELLGAASGALRRASHARPVMLAVETPGLAGVRRYGDTEPCASVSQSATMRATLDTLDRVARGVVPILLIGETGTGKEVLARRIHAKSGRSRRTLVSVNCAAIPAQLVESTLFGHEKGAFTGATQRAYGVFETADSGTVFLDEIGELPLAAQAALLRVLETKTFSRVGASQEIGVDVRIVAATNRDLELMVARAAFREDLLYRLNTITLRVPPLRERRDDIPELARQLLQQVSIAHDMPLPSIDADAMDMLTEYAWPGNVRELRNVLERAMAVMRSATITVDDLPERLLVESGIESSRVSHAGAESHIDLGGLDGDFRSRLERIEMELLRHALAAEKWNQTHTARRLGMPLRTLVHKIKVLGIKRPG
jgi:DNA-binding NtrC family response regulator